MLTSAQDMTLFQLQCHLDSIYGKVNRKMYDGDKILLHTFPRLSKMMKGIRKDDRKRIEQHISLLFAWVIAVANQFNFNMEHELLVRFPNCCPYCTNKPCVCGHVRPEERAIVQIGKVEVLSTKVADIQNMLKSIYPENTLEKSGMHLVEEVGELVEEVLIYHHDETRFRFEKIRLEFTDVIANLFAVASCAGINMAELMFETYKNGCPSCGKQVCGSGFLDEWTDVVANTMPQ
jgi:NTP pyrophosphatase (non-canonical NTP hydrolase)